MLERQDFNAMVATAMRDPDVAHMRPVIEKELLHFDLLYALEQGGFLNELVFQGGTSLRLCYGGSRFSEDLDFAGGPEFSTRQMVHMKQCLEDYLSARYGLEVFVKEPASLRQEPEYENIRIDKWQLSVATAPERRDIPRQRIKIEVASIPAYTAQAMPLHLHYDFLPKEYSNTLVMVEASHEIMADKLVSLPMNTRYVRNRDIWDLAWLAQRGVAPDAELVQLKIADYRHTREDYLSCEAALRGNLAEIIEGERFTQEMSRFLPATVFERTVGDSRFHGYLESTVGRLFSDVRQQLNPAPSSRPSFRM